MSKKYRNITVFVSTLALMAAPARMAGAMMTISCGRNIDFGRIVPSCAGSITVRASAGSGTINNGCHSLVGGAIQPGTCTVRTTIATATMNARITFMTASIQFSNGASGTVTLDNYRLQTGGGSVVGSHTYAAALINPTHTFNVGGRIRFGAAEPVGSYNSTFNIVLTAIP